MDRHWRQHSLLLSTPCIPSSSNTDQRGTLSAYAPMSNRSAGRTVRNIKQCVERLVNCYAAEWDIVAENVGFGCRRGLGSSGL